MDKTELEAVLARIDIWLLVFGIIVVVGVAGESFFGMRHWWNSRKLQALQQAENDEQRAEIARLTKAAGEAMERAANAERETAELNRKAEQERLARIKIEEKLAPRLVSAEQAVKLKAALVPMNGKSLVLNVITGNPENEAFGESLAVALRECGLTVEVRPGFIFSSAPLPHGLSMTSGQNRTADAETLANALISVGLVKPPPPIIIDLIKDEAAQMHLELVVAPR